MTRAEGERLCLECHDGSKASAESHPIGRPVDAPDLTVPPDWPLNKNKLTCVTCHDVLAGCRTGISRPPANPQFLRRPGRSLKNFCTVCHPSRQFPRVVPHIMLRNSRDIIQWNKQPEIDEDACLFCHLSVPDPNRLRRTHKPDLRLDQVKLCRLCHPDHRLYYTPGHIGDEVSPSMMAYITARELLGLDTRPEKRYLDRLERDQARPLRMIFAPGDIITCTTCHNPHQEGVFPPESVLNYQAFWLVSPGRVASPSTDQNMCFHCHPK